MTDKHIKIILSIVLTLFVVGFVYINGYPDDHSLFMNGRVADKHSFTEMKCMKCHVPWKGVPERMCIECHVDDEHYLRNELDKSIAEELRCFDCHQEHRGKSFDLEVAEYLAPGC